MIPSLGKGKIHSKYDSKLHLVASLQFWSFRKYTVIPSLPLILDQLKSKVIVPAKFLSMGQTNLFDIMKFLPI